MVFDDGVRDKFFSVFVVLHLEVRVLLVFKFIPASCLQIDDIANSSNIKIRKALWDCSGVVNRKTFLCRLVASS